MFLALVLSKKTDDNGQKTVKKCLIIRYDQVSSHPPSTTLGAILIPPSPGGIFFSGVIMPKLPPRPCTYPGCTAMQIKRGYCQQHQDNGGWQKRTDYGRIKGPKWKAIKRRIMERDGWLCQVCKSSGKLSTATEVDHVNPLSLGGTDADDNLQAICQSCHKRKTASEAHRARKGRCSPTQ